MSADYMRAPFPWFGGKSKVVDIVWKALGRPKQYIEPFCGSAAMLLGAPAKASLEVVNDLNGFVANFWRCVKHCPEDAAQWADYPVSHIDLGARHAWLMAQRDRLGAELQDPDWPGDPKVAGWWLWGQCCWIGSGWCDWFAVGQIPHVGSAGMGVQAVGQIPHVGSAGMGVQAAGKIPHVSGAGMGVQAVGQIPHVSDAGMDTTGGLTALAWLATLAARLERVRVTHGDWHRCLNNHYGGSETAVFLDPPYTGYEQLYGSDSVWAEVVEWCRANPDIRIALCGHAGDADLDGWTEHRWSRGRATYSGTKTTDSEALWFSPACHEIVDEQASLDFGGAA